MVVNIRKQLHSLVDFKNLGESMALAPLLVPMNGTLYPLKVSSLTYKVLSNVL